MIKLDEVFDKFLHKYFTLKANVWNNVRRGFNVRQIQKSKNN